MKKILLLLLFIGSLYLSAYLFYELNPKNWYSIPTIFISLIITATSFLLTLKEFTN